MQIKVKEVREVVVDLNAGDAVELDSLAESRFGRRYRITRIVENLSQTYVVFNNGTWRPLSTYGITWRKVQ